MFLVYFLEMYHCSPLSTAVCFLHARCILFLHLNFYQQVKLLKSACEKEMEEIQKNYESLVREAENTLLQKKEDLRSYYQKVCANKILAETMILFKEQVNLRRTQGAYLSHFLYSFLSPSSISSTANQFQIIEAAFVLKHII